MHRNLSRPFALALGLTLLAFSAEAGESLNRKVVQFAVDHLGKKVGDGECASLVVAALQAAGAQPPVASKGDFSYGQPIKQKTLTPGDIIHFVKARFESSSSSGTSWSEFPLHTAIVQRVAGTRVTAAQCRRVSGARTAAVGYSIVFSGTTSGERPRWPDPISTIAVANSNQLASPAPAK